MRVSHIKRQFLFTAFLVALLAITAIPVICQGLDSTTDVTPNLGYYNNKPVYYLMTDSSDASYATMFGLNYSPVLTNALLNPYLPKVYYVVGQGLVFSTEWPAAYKAGSYMPYWALQLVTWNAGKTVRALGSVASINSAVLSGDVSVVSKNIVLAVSILINSSGSVIPQGKVSTATGKPVVTLPVFGVFFFGKAYGMLRLEFSNTSMANVYGGIYVPLLSTFNVMRVKGQPAAWQDLYSQFTTPPLFQLPVGSQIWTVPGPGNTSAGYTPLMVEWQVRTIHSRSTPYTSVAQILAANLRLTATNYWSNNPVIQSSDF